MSYVTDFYFILNYTVKSFNLFEEEFYFLVLSLSDKWKQIKVFKLGNFSFNGNVDIRK